ncbi:MAG: multidrug effflux MFS transporter [Parachlamydiaceae bacterium]|nr:multidrug effflux MFS transporter [Parachlamydiaceae bacterium]
MNSKLYHTFYLLLLISLGYVATDIYLPSLPAISSYFQVSDNKVQMTLFSYLLSFSMAPIIFGPLSDHIGRKKVLLGGVLLGMLATCGCLFAQNINWLIISRFFQGVGMGAVLISSRAAVADIFTGKALAKQMSFMTMLMPLVLATAPTIGGLLQENFQWQAVFIFLICYMILILILVLFTPESLKNSSNEKTSQIFSKYSALLKNRLFLIFGINFALPSLGFFAYLTVSPFLFQHMIGLSPATYGSLALYVGGAILVTGYINLKLVHHFLITQILYLGSGLILLAGCLLMFFYMNNILTTWSLLVPSLIFFSCMPFCVANAGSKSLSFVHGNFGAASALLTTFQLLLGASVSFIFSYISDETTFSLALCFIFVGVLSLVNLTYACKLEKKCEFKKE